MTNNAVVALIEDDQALANAMSRYLAEFGFRIERGCSCADARALGRAGGIDLFILDRNLPDGDGLDLAAALKALSGAAVIILSGMGDVEARVKGLNTGADDYLTKPAAPEELLARVNAVMRRTGEKRENRRETLQRFPSFTLDSVNNCILGAGDQQRQLTETETQILGALIGARGAVVKKEGLSQSALGRAWQPDDRSLDVHISRLRQKLREIGVAEKVIHTVRSQGYRLIAA